MSSSMRQRGQAPSSSGSRNTAGATSAMHLSSQSPPPTSSQHQQLLLHNSQSRGMASWEISAETPERQLPRAYRRRASADTESDDNSSLQQQQQQQLPPHSWETANPRSMYYNAIGDPDNDAATPQLNSFHTLYRTAHHVPDSQYQEYLLGQTARRKQNAWITPHCLGSLCAGFSLVGFVFLLAIGVLLDRQPLLVKGVLLDANANTNSNSTTTAHHATRRMVPRPYADADFERLPMARVAYQAAFFYLVVYVVCYCLTRHPDILSNPRQVALRILRNNGINASKAPYERIPDHLPHNTANGNGHHMNNNSGGGIRPAAYRAPCWNRCTIALTNWLYARGWYTPGRHRGRRPQDDRNARTV